MKFLLFIVFLCTYGKVESATSPFQAIASLFTDFAQVIRTHVDIASQKVRFFLYNLFRDKAPKMPVIHRGTPRGALRTKTTTHRAVTGTTHYLETLKSVYGEWRTTDDIVQDHKREVQRHYVNTSDGYELILHRLVNLKGYRTNKQTVVLYHGLLGSSADWILLGPDKSLPYLLSALGYDVWLANARGNRYSRFHGVHSIEGSELWNFSWEEIGMYDMPAIIDYVKQTTNESINFVAHSMGGTALLTLLSTEPKYNEYLRTVVLLGPLVYMKHAKGPMRVLANLNDTPTSILWNVFGNGSFAPSRFTPDILRKRFCLEETLFCGNPLFFLSGVPRNHSQWNPNFRQLVFQQIPAGGSTKTVMHYLQLVRSGKFHRYGNESNEFPLKGVTAPIALISSSDDWLATIPDLVRLYINVMNPVEHHIIRDKNLSHTDFVWGQDAPSLVFSKVIELLTIPVPANKREINEI